jgi:hypothetical protein
LAVAAAVLASVSVYAARSSPRPLRPGAQAQWDSRALPHVTLLVGDLTGLQSDMTAGASTPTPAGALAADTARLGRDTAGARTLPEPPSGYIASQWSAALAQADAVVSASEHLQAVTGQAPPARQAALDVMEAAVRQAGQSLLRLAAALRD